MLWAAAHAERCVIFTSSGRCVDRTFQLVKEPLHVLLSGQPESQHLRLQFQLPSLARLRSALQPENSAFCIQARLDVLTRSDTEAWKNIRHLSTPGSFSALPTTQILPTETVVGASAHSTELQARVSFSTATT